MIASTFIIVFIRSSNKVEPLLTNTSVKRTPRVCSCLSLLLLFDSKTHGQYRSHLRCPSYREFIHLSHNIGKIKRTMVSRVRPIIRATCEHKNASRWVICNLPQNLFIFRSSFHCCAMLFFVFFFVRKENPTKLSLVSSLFIAFFMSRSDMLAICKKSNLTS